MNIAILTSSTQHPVYPYLQTWCANQRHHHDVILAHDKDELPEAGDILFLVSCSYLIPQSIRSRFRHTLVLHASDLPKGRGWSPHVWEVLAGADTITVTLLEAEDKVDSGRIWAKRQVTLDGTELYDEINEKLFQAELSLLDYTVANVDSIEPVVQDESVEPTYHPRRTPADSELDPHRSLAEQFNLLRVSDPERFPAFFRLRGARYKVKIERMDDDE